MNFSDLAKKRRSIRKFTPEKLTALQVEQIMKTALMAPSSKNRTPWQFVLVEDKALLASLAACKLKTAKLVESCALAIVVVANPLLSDVWIEDASIASIMIQLQAEDLGLGSCWIQVRGRETADGQSSEEYIRLLLDIPMHMQVLSIIAIGNKENTLPQFDEDKLQWEKLHIEKFKSE